jgi:hypothetical protein
VLSVRAVHGYDLKFGLADGFSAVGLTGCTIISAPRVGIRNARRVRSGRSK